MTSELGELFRRRRTTLGWTLPELARQTGYRNLSKGARRLESLERDGVAARALVERAAAALGLDPQQVADIATRDDPARQAAFEAWLRVPQPMELYGFVAGVTFGLPLPEGLTEEHAIAYAADVQEAATSAHVPRARSEALALDGVRRPVPRCRSVA